MQNVETRRGHSCCYSINIKIERTSGQPPSLRVYQNVLLRGLLFQICQSWFNFSIYLRSFCWCNQQQTNICLRIEQDCQWLNNGLMMYIHDVLQNRQRFGQIKPSKFLNTKIPMWVMCSKLPQTSGCSTSGMSFVYFVKLQRFYSAFNGATKQKHMSI